MGEDNDPVFRCRHSHDETGRVFLHRGSAARQFQRSFVLAEGIEITGAALDNGLLHIDLHRKTLEPEVRTIKIECAPPGDESGPRGAKTIDVEAKK